MPAEGRSLCTSLNCDCWQNLSCKLSAALSHSLKKPLTLLIPSPVDTLSKHLLLARIRAGRSSLVNPTLAAILDFFVYRAVNLNFTQYALQCSHAPSCGWVGHARLPHDHFRVFESGIENSLSSVSCVVTLVIGPGLAHSLACTAAVVGQEVCTGLGPSSCF